MWKHSLCLGTGAFGLSIPEQLRLFHETGFDGFFTGWSPDSPVADWKALADTLGLHYQSLHAPFTNAAKLWESGPDAEQAVHELIACLHTAAENGIPIVVAHAFIGFERHDPTPDGIENYGRAAAAAERLGVKLALENTEGEEYLAALMDAFKGMPSVGFCWDTGHELCYNHGQDMLALYGDRLICTHLNDNLGIKAFDGTITWIDDLHLLPFDGIADWSGIASRLDHAGYTGELTFELSIQSKPGRHENDPYARLDIRDYLTEVYKRACRVAALRK